MHQLLPIYLLYLFGNVLLHMTEEIACVHGTRLMQPGYRTCWGQHIEAHNVEGLVTQQTARSEWSPVLEAGCVPAGP